MDPERIDTSVISISDPPVIMETNTGSAAPADLRKSNTTESPSAKTTKNAPVPYTNTAASPRLTDALEALLGGLDSPTAEAELLETLTETSSTTEGAVDTPIPANKSATQVPNLNTVQAEASILPHVAPILGGGDFPERTVEAKSVPTLGKDIEAAQTADAITASQTVKSLSSADIAMVDGKVEGQSLEVALPEPKLELEPANVQMNEAQLVLEQSIQDGQPPMEVDAAQLDATDIPMGENGEGEGEHPEWEADSSPIDSSSDDSSDDSSSDDSEDGDNTYKLLSPEEQARILMADGNSDDEGTAKGKGGSGGQLRTKNEEPEVVVPKPNVTITPEMEIVNLGVIETIVDNIALVKARTSGEYRVLESGSVLCLEDRSVIGVVAEPLGRVQQPLYSILFTNAGELKAAGLGLGTNVFYTEKFATFVFTQALKAYKGSDASNIHDEEVGDEEMEFSDDEAEAEYKRRAKQAKRGGRGRDGGFGRGGHPLQQQHDARSVVNYDEAEDGPYRPLARPVGLINSLGHVEAPQEGEDFGARHVREQSRGGGRGDRGGSRGDRGRGRGDRGRGDRGGRGRGNNQNRGGPNNGGSGNGGGSSNGYSQPPQNRPTSSHQQNPPSFTQNSPSNGFPARPTPNSFNVPQQQFSPNQSQFPAWPQFPPPPPQFQGQPFQQAGFQQAMQTMQQMQQQMQNTWPNMQMPMPPVPQMPGGAFFNPAFFGNNQASNNQAGNNQGGSNNGQWSQQTQRGGGQNRGGGNGGAKKDEDRY